MPTVSTLNRIAFVALILLVAATAVWASSATFAITGEGVTLGEAKEIEEGGKEVQRFQAKATVGKPFTLAAQGMVLPKGGKAEPGEPEAGTWTFDEKSFKKLVPDAKADKTKVVIRLEPTIPGTTRVRFAGKILGYERTFDVLIDVVDKK